MTATPNPPEHATLRNRDTARGDDKSRGDGKVMVSVSHSSNSRQLVVPQGKS
jgi:hypothetical protein